MVDADLIAAVVVFSAVLVGFLAVGGAFNRRRAGRYANALKPSFLGFGETSITWIGRSTFRYDVAKTKAPFQRASALVELLPRELPLQWAIAAAMGKADTLTLRGNLRSPPRVEFEVYKDRGYFHRGMALALEGRGWVTRAVASTSMVLAAPADALVPAQRLLESVQGSLGSLWRLGISKAEPHVTAVLDPRGSPDDHARQVELLLRVGELVAGKVA